MSRFDYVKYNDAAIELQNKAKQLCVQLEGLITSIPKTSEPTRPTEIALRKLEEVYMWIGKAIRDDQIACSGPAVELQEERKDG